VGRCERRALTAPHKMVLPILSVVRFFALQGKKRTTKEDKVLL
jgi:hypothetical protein